MNDMCLETNAVRDGVMSTYVPTYDACGDVIAAAGGRLTRAEMIRAAKMTGVWTDEGIDVDDEQLHACKKFIVDLALFERNQLGRRPFDRFMATHSRGLDPFQRTVGQTDSEIVFLDLPIRRTP